MKQISIPFGFVNLPPGKGHNSPRIRNIDDLPHPFGPEIIV